MSFNWHLREVNLGVFAKGRFWDDLLRFPGMGCETMRKAGYRCEWLKLPRQRGLPRSGCWAEVLLSSTYKFSLLLLYSVNYLKHLWKFKFLVGSPLPGLLHLLWHPKWIAIARFELQVCHSQVVKFFSVKGHVTVQFQRPILSSSETSLCRNLIYCLWNCLLKNNIADKWFKNRSIRLCLRPPPCLRYTCGKFSQWPSWCYYWRCTSFSKIPHSKKSHLLRNVQSGCPKQTWHP